MADKNLHPVMQQALAPFMPRMSAQVIPLTKASAEHVARREQAAWEDEFILQASAHLRGPGGPAERSLAVLRDIAEMTARLARDVSEKIGEVHPDFISFSGVRTLPDRINEQVSDCFDGPAGAAVHSATVTEFVRLGLKASLEGK